MPSESQHTINERLKFLIDRSGLSIRKFSSLLGVSDTNTRNYLDRGSKLNSEYIEKVLRQFSDINPTWFIMGDGEPFTSEASTSVDINAKKNKGNVQSTNSGSNTINHITLSECQRDLEAARKEAELLREQLTMKDTLLAAKDAIIAAKDEMLTLLRGGHNRPN